MNKKLLIAVIIIAIVVVALLAYFFRGLSDSSKFSLGGRSSVSAQEQADLSNSADYVPETEEIDIGDVI